MGLGVCVLVFVVAAECVCSGQEGCVISGLEAGAHWRSSTHGAEGKALTLPGSHR